MKQLSPAEVSARETAPDHLHTTLTADTYLIDLNVLAQKSFGSVNLDLKRLQAMVRCDQLPHIVGREDRLIQLFRNMVELIVNLPSADNKLFIHVKLNSDATDEIEHQELKEWEISVHTNRCVPQSWEEMHSEKLIECSEICREHQSQFIFHTKNTGCLFSLTIPGVLNTSNFG